MTNHGRHPDSDGLCLRVPKCLCGMFGVLSRRYDAYYCPDSRVWLERECYDPSCGFCADRPETAMEEP